MLEEKCLYIFLLQYLFIAILCAKILCVNWALMDYFLMQQTSKLNSEIWGLVKQTQCFSTRALHSVITVLL